MNANKFTTYDLNLASVLITLDYELYSLDKTNPKKVCFIFKKKKNIKKTASDYFNDKIKVSALTLLNNQKNLKNPYNFSSSRQFRRNNYLQHKTHQKLNSNFLFDQRHLHNHYLCK